MSLQLHLSPWEGDRADNPGNHFQALEGWESHQDQSAWFDQCEVMLILPNNIL